jgi:iron complex outermembrane receptor protein
MEASSTFYNRFYLSAFYSYIHAGYDRCPPKPTPADCFMDQGVNVSASRLLGTAKNTVGSTARYTQPLGVAGSAMASVTYYLRSSTAYASDNVLNYEAIAPGYNIFNARLEWSNLYGTGLSIAAFADNVANKTYVVAGFGLGSQIGTDSRIYGEPRTYGINLNYRF